MTGVEEGNSSKALLYVDPRTIWNGMMRNMRNEQTSDDKIRQAVRGKEGWHLKNISRANQL